MSVRGGVGQLTGDELCRVIVPAEQQIEIDGDALAFGEVRFHLGDNAVEIRLLLQSPYASARTESPMPVP